MSIATQAWRGQAFEQLRLLLYAVQFLTRVPVPAWVGHTPDMLERSVRYYPLVGGLVGLGGGIVYLLASLVFAPLVAAVLSVLATVLLTGAFHEDGLADTWDGVGGGLDRERVLEIMRDSRIGTYGGAALVFTLLLRVSALAMFSPLTGLLALISAHALGRLMVVGVTRVSRYVRAEGLAKPVADGVDRQGAMVALVTGVLLALVSGPAGLAALVAALIAAALMLRLLHRKLGGYTGDGLGAIEQTSEVAALLTLAALLA
ncbi:MAG: adenosylcobinamide-GDP ribazoletransferase [Gammaproteobacteria bacterium]|nr:adenosylcobinamide-GDP ribazoletransferase [Gammaproteobacteria bacterium]